MRDLKHWGFGTITVPRGVEEFGSSSRPPLLRLGRRKTKALDTTGESDGGRGGRPRGCQFAMSQCVTTGPASLVSLRGFSSTVCSLYYPPTAATNTTTPTRRSTPTACGGGSNHSLSARPRLVSDCSTAAASSTSGSSRISGSAAVIITYSPLATAIGAAAAATSAIATLTIRLTQAMLFILSIFIASLWLLR